MLFVLSKEKIISYIIAFSTVAILLGIAMLGMNQEESIETASNLREVPIYCVDTRRSKSISYYQLCMECRRH